MKHILISPPATTIHGQITLEGSKSISNRLLIMQALCSEPLTIRNLSPSDDTRTLQNILSSKGSEHNVGAAGTTMRFLISYFSTRPGTWTLTGSERMKNRPIGILVDALRELGAHIIYLEKEGYPPITIEGKKLHGGKLSMRADVSSQFISSVMMIAPLLEEGIDLELQGKISSYPYLNMTLQLMKQLGIQYREEGNRFKIFPGSFSGKNMVAESDWSAASYYFSVCALNKHSEIRINGLLPGSLQGDSVLPEIYRHFGVSAIFDGETLVLKNNLPVTDFLEFDFSDCPDIAQTVAVSAAALGIPMAFTGVESLKIKETDRTHALSVELKKFGVSFYEADGKWKLEGKTKADHVVTIGTYEDHRMAMCFAPLSLLHALQIEDGDVVNKSYPSFWKDLSSLGFSISST